MFFVPILDFLEATAISRLHLLTSSGENRKHIKIDFLKVVVGKRLFFVQILDFVEATAISRLHLLRTSGENRNTH